MFGKGDSVWKWPCLASMLNFWVYCFLPLCRGSTCQSPDSTCHNVQTSPKRSIRMDTYIHIKPIEDPWEITICLWTYIGMVDFHGLSLNGKIYSTCEKIGWFIHPEMDPLGYMELNWQFPVPMAKWNNWVDRTWLVYKHDRYPPFSNVGWEFPCEATGVANYETWTKSGGFSTVAGVLPLTVPWVVEPTPLYVTSKHQYTQAHFPSTQIQGQLWLHQSSIQFQETLDTWAATARPPRNKQRPGPQWVQWQTKGTLCHCSMD